MPKVATCLLFGLVLTACGGGGSRPPPDVLGFIGLSAEAVFAYEVDVGGFLQTGQVKVVGTDPAYKDGVNAYKLEYRQNSILIATRWFQVNEQGLFLLGEAASENSQWVERKFLTSIKIIPYPIEDPPGHPVPSWSTDSEIQQGGAETHRFDNLGAGALDVPAGEFQAYHLVHTRTIQGTGTVTLDEYFVPEHWFVRFEYPEGQLWSLANP